MQVPSDGSVRSLRALLGRIDEQALAGLTVHTPDLDDVFLALTSQPGEPAPNEQLEVRP